VSSVERLCAVEEDLANRPHPSQEFGGKMFEMKRREEKRGQKRREEKRNNKNVLRNCP